MLAGWLILLRLYLCLCLCLCLCQHVLTGHYSDINISISIRRTQRFDIMLMLMLMSWLSSLPHKLLLCLYLCLCLCLPHWWGQGCPSLLVHGRPSLPLYHNLCFTAVFIHFACTWITTHIVRIVLLCSSLTTFIGQQKVCVFPFDVVFERDVIPVGLWTAIYST